jgi:histidinol dehydrogenase
VASEWDPHDVVAELRRQVPARESVSPVVTEILEQVRREGDAALARLTEQLDTAGEPAPVPRVSDDELEHAAQRLDPAVAGGLRTAYQNVLEAARAGLAQATPAVEDTARRITFREAPVHRAAVYAPGGRANYPSTVIMGVAAARAAEVPEIVVCSHPRADPVILGACAIAGVNEVYRIAGAQAIGALAYGTETVAAVDVIVGPGNLYVQEAKRQVSAVVGIDGFAGPSDLMAIVERGVDKLEPIVLDLLAQAEHGADSLVVAVSTSEEILAELRAAVSDGPSTGGVIRFVHVPSLEDALELAEAFAPEHLQLVGEEAECLAPRITRAGCLFVGALTGTAFGDYIVGSNHVLPTNGSARFASGLSAAQFRRRFAEVRIRDADELARAAAPIARAEGFPLHARSMEARIRDNRSS